MTMKKMTKGLCATTLATLSLPLPGLTIAEDATAQANNPLADIKAFNVQNYYIGELTTTDEDANQMVLRYAQPFSIGESDWLMRASLPINTFPAGLRGAHQTGTGDADIFAAYLIDTGNPAVSFGVGPQLVAPTASDEALGNEQWQAGVANVYFNATSAKYQYGYLLIYRGGIGDTNDRERVSLAAMQPFFFYQLKDGWYTGTAPLWNYDFQSDNYSVPVGARLGKVLKANKTVFNVFLEPQVSAADRGPGQPEWQLFFAVNMQFL